MMFVYGQPVPTTNDEREDMQCNRESAMIPDVPMPYGTEEEDDAELVPTLAALILGPAFCIAVYYGVYTVGCAVYRMVS